MIFDLIVHQRLSENRLILLIVSISSVSNNINKDIFVKFLTISHSDLDDLVQNVRSVSVYMDNRGIYCFSYLCAVVR